MANLAQTVNVLQAVILTYDDVMIKTPTYHVFDLYKEHQENTYIPVEQNVSECKGLPQTSSTASFDEETKVLYYSVSNADSENNAEMNIVIKGLDKITSSHARLLTAPEITSHNTVENPDFVDIVDFDELTVKGSEVSFILPPRSVMTVEIK